jgi:ABC-type antimicrobial peptide transport system permease subunit
MAGVLATLLYGVKPADPLSFAGAAILLAVVTIVACIVPAARAARISPLKCD